MGRTGIGITVCERRVGDGDGERERLATGLRETGEAGLRLRLALGVRLRVCGDGL